MVSILETRRGANADVQRGPLVWREESIKICPAWADQLELGHGWAQITAAYSGR